MYVCMCIVFCIYLHMYICIICVHSMCICVCMYMYVCVCASGYKEGRTTFTFQQIDKDPSSRLGCLTFPTARRTTAAGGRLMTFSGTLLAGEHEPLTIMAPTTWK